MISDEQQLLEIFSSNYNYHTETYNTDFNNLIYGNMCEYLSFANSTAEECAAFNLGVLQKGLYSTTTKYLSQLTQINSKFLIAKGAGGVSEYVNDQKVVLQEKTCDLYMQQIHQHLVEILEKDINYL